jgi:hypothetical protein
MTGSLALFRRMLVEEYRLHAELFGSRRFLAFPLFVAALAGSGVALLRLTGTGLGAVVAGLHALVLFFGLQVGTIGLVGRDAMRDALGDVTLLVFSARTLPISWRRLLATFLVKDLGYYAVLFLTPAVIGVAPVALVAGQSVTTVGLLWVTVVGTFALGAAVSLALVSLGTRSKAALVGLVAAGTLAVVTTGFDPVAYTPYAFYADPGVATALAGFGSVVFAATIGPLVFDPSSGQRTRRVRRDRYQTLRRLPGVDALTVRPLLEVIRSSGSVWKVLFSLGVLFAVTALLLDRVVAATALQPSVGIAFGTLLGLGTFTTYNWVTQFDDPREYLRYPAGMDAVFAAKFRAHLLLAVPAGLVYLVLAVVWYPVGDLLIGLVVFPLVTVYVYGVTAFLTGLSPNELLFDTGRFAVFGMALSLLAVPLLVAALAVDTAPVVAVGGSVAVAAVAAVLGTVLARRAGPRWQATLRRE